MKDKYSALRLFREHDAFIQDRINCGIEQNRKGYFSLKLCDESGAPIRNAKVTAVLKNHEFRFGANYSAPVSSEAYEESFRKLFNLANIDPGWEDTEAEARALDFCRKTGIEPRLRAIASEGAFPKHLHGAGSDEVRESLGKRLDAVADRYAPCARSVEAVRGIFGYDENVPFYNENAYVAHCLQATEKRFSPNQIVLNELSHVWYDGLGLNRDRYYMAIENLLARNTRIDAIGMEFRMNKSAREQFLDSMRVHMYVGWWPEEMETYRKAYDPVHLLKTIHKYSDFHRPLHITGVMIPSYTNETEDEEIQAELLRYLYSIWFSQERVEQIILWNLTDGFEGDAGEKTEGLCGGLLRQDLSRKPAYEALDSLIHKQWHTEETFQTDEAGTGRFKGFYGDYELTVEAGTQTFTETVSFSKERTYSLCPIWGKDRQIIRV